MFTGGRYLIDTAQWCELGSVVAASYRDILQEVASGGDSSCNSRSVGE